MAQFDQAEFDLMAARVQRARTSNNDPDRAELTVAAIALVEMVEELRTELAVSEEIGNQALMLSITLSHQCDTFARQLHEAGLLEIKEVDRRASE